MPKVSKRQKKIAALQQKIQSSRREIATKIATASEEELDFIVDKAIDEMIFDASALELSQVLSSRYLDTGRKHSTRMPPNQFDYNAFILNEKKFVQTVRMTKQAFDHLVDELKGHKVYQCRGVRSQTDIRIQIMLVLDRIGSHSSGNFIGRLARNYGVSEGSVVKFTKRFFEAVINTWQTKYLSWPTDEEKREIKSANAEKKGFKDCIGFVDGMTVDLAWKPSEKGSAFLNGKNKYSMRSMGVCDHNMKIRFLTTGPYGSGHDSKVFSCSDIGKYPANYFSGNEYLLADAEYTLTEQTITPFKNIDLVDPDKHQFNDYHASIREAVTQTFGLLKMRFQSLRELPLQIKSLAKDMAFAQQWILVCVILHNRLRTLGGIDIDLAQYDSEPVTKEEAMDKSNNLPEINEVEGYEQVQLKREFIMTEVLRFNSAA